MAFQSGTNVVRCFECKTEGKFFKMFQSFRPDHAWQDEEGRTKAVLLCVDCEVKTRQAEWERWTEEEKEVAGENYPTLAAVQKDQKSRAKESWTARSEPIKCGRAALKALKEGSDEVVQVNFVECMKMMKIEDLKEEDKALAVPGASHDGPDSKRPKSASTLPTGRADEQLVEVKPDKALTSKQMKMYVIRKSKDLARGLMGLMRGSVTLDAFANAGKAMIKQLDLYAKLGEAKAAWDKSRTEKDFDTLEAIEDEYEKAHEYQTAMEHGQAEQTRYLKALDYGDVLCEGWRRFYVCKAGGTGNHCGFAFPSKLWRQKGRTASPDISERLMPGNWQYSCCCMWEYLQEESVDHPNSAADVWFQDMMRTYDEMEKFPHIGCGATYVPWKKGPSMVCEIQLRQQGDGKDWEAFLADHTPQALDDQLKKLSYDALSKTFQSLSPDIIMKAIPVTMPMTHLATVSGKKMDGVAKYPLYAWTTSGAPEFTNEKWCMICILLAERGKGATQSGTFSNDDAEVFDKLFTVANTMKETKAYR